MKFKVAQFCVGVTSASVVCGSQAANQKDFEKAITEYLNQEQASGLYCEGQDKYPTTNLTVSIKLCHYAWVFIERMNNHAQAFGV
jgi:hypothetical protein